MNLLPFVMVIIMVLSLFSLSQFEGAIAQKKENQIYLAYFRGLRETRNEKEKIAYERTLVKKEGDQKKSNEKLTSQPSQNYFREKRVGWEKGKLNLSSLLKEPYKYPALETIVIEYVKDLYSHADFFPKNDKHTKALIKALIKQYKKVDPLTPFHELTFSDSNLQDIFYKMVRGTHTYDLEMKIGYPPFGEMFTFEKSDRPPMNYHYANLSFLSIVFGEKITKDFVELEKKELISAKKKCLSPIKKPEFESLLRNQMVGEKNTVLELFDFTYEASSQNPAKYLDTKTQITVKVQ
ncbi:MAG: hypothetical protein KFB93_00905 [Simkaniaceae bacterium]|nr:MAG: hypothetical protein KFB93_00905 [Simkaniaceae bacterium]